MRPKSKSKSSWLRLFGWGLFASLAVHWIAFDVLRSRAWIPAGSPSAAFQVTLNKAPAITRATESKLAPLSAPEPTQKSRPRPIIRGQADLPQAPATAIQSPTEFAAPLDGLRSEQPAEAMVAMRIAVARSWVSSPAMLGATSRAVILWCDFDESGRLVGVRSEAGAITPVLQASAKQSIAKIRTPKALIGRAFALDLMFEFEE